jgi:hypothetical protein
VFENMMLRAIFELKREEIKVGFRKFYNEEIPKLYCSPKVSNSDQVKGNDMGKFCSKYEGKGDAYGRLVRNQKEGDH